MLRRSPRDRAQGVIVRPLGLRRPRPAHQRRLRRGLTRLFNHRPPGDRDQVGNGLRTGRRSRAYLRVKWGAESSVQPSSRRSSRDGVQWGRGGCSAARLHVPPLRRWMRARAHRRPPPAPPPPPGTPSPPPHRHLRARCHRLATRHRRATRAARAPKPRRVAALRLTPPGRSATSDQPRADRRRSGGDAALPRGQHAGGATTTSLRDSGTRSSAERRTHGRRGGDVHRPPTCRQGARLTARSPEPMHEALAVN
jgi:hypothetical protein